MNASCYQTKGVGNVVTLFRAREAKAPYNVTPKSQAVKVEVVDSEELSYDELQKRIVLERQVERVFYIAGRALRFLREKRLYRSTHTTFEEYCKQRFGFTHRHVNYLIAGSQVVENLMGTNNSQTEVEQVGTNGSKIEDLEMGTNNFQIEVEKMGTNGSQIEDSEMGTKMVRVLPTSERQVRPLISLQADEQRICWKMAVSASGGKVPSGRVVKDIVDRIQERTKIPNPYKKGEICVLLPKNNPDLRGKGGCWGAITRVGDYSCTIETWDGEYTVKIQHLLSLNLCDDGCKFVQDLLVRLRRLHAAPNRDSATDSLLAFFGKEHKTYLTEAQEELLTVLERKAQLIQ